jgi:DNA mismatch endonuclease (patch repair protein)
MASIRKRDTRPELLLRRMLRASGIRGYRCHLRAVPGSPDVAFTRWRVAVFVDGVWWHGHPDWLPHGRRGPYWDSKIAGNVARDRRVDEQLSDLGWTVVRIWDVDVLREPAGAAEVVRMALKAARHDIEDVTSGP